MTTTGGTQGTASGLTAQPGCVNGRAQITLSWKPGGSAEQQVLVSARPDGLDSGNFTSSDVLPASQSTYLVRESQPGGIFYWRVLTRQGGGWAASATATFEGPTCVAF